MYVGVPGEETGINKPDNSGNKLSYAEAVAERSEIEEKIGLSLAKDARLTNIAAKITKNVGARSYRQLSPLARKKIDGEMDTFGGARAFKEGWGTLGASVFAVMNEIEQDGETKTHYSISHAENHPYFPKDKKKPEFDEPLASLSWGDLPKDAKQSLAADPNNGPFSKLPATTYDELDFKGRLTLLKGFRYSSTTAQTTALTLKEQLSQTLPEETRDRINEAFASPQDGDKRQAAIEAIQAVVRTSTDDNRKAQLGALLDIVIDRHTSGDNTNLVQRKRDGGVKDQWIEDTVKAGKPIISGPSGHTLRYLNFWAEKRNEADPTEVNDTEKWPSLEAARLVMMANLMPPKHHSYDEIMTASIGIKDNGAPALEYHKKTSYRDLLFYHTQNDAKPIAKNTFIESDAKLIDNDDNDGLDISIKQNIDARKNKQDAINELMEVAKNKDTADIKRALATLSN